MEMYRVNTYSGFIVERFKVKRVDRNTVVYVDKFGSEYKDDLSSTHTNWFNTLSEVKGYAEGFLIARRKKVDVLEIEINKTIKGLSE